jgi:peptide chain release factor 1
VGRGRFDNATELLIELVAGEGGDDSRDFARELLAMYVHYGQSRGLAAELLADDDAHLTLRFSGRGVWAAFASEPGNHVVQRVPNNDRKGKRQTSVVAVMVLPLPPADRRVTLLPESELDIKFQPKGGPGGQHRNKTASACRMKHRPTGLSVFIDGRNQHQNRELAHRILSGRVEEIRRASDKSGYDSVRANQWTGAGRGEKVRTYNLLENRVTDHRTGRKTTNVKAVMKGELNLVLEASE